MVNQTGYKAPAKSKTEPKRTRGRPPGSNAQAVILAGAWQAFAVYGFHDCSVANILEYSGSSRTNFYRFFKNKEEVFAILLEQSISRLESALDQAFKDARHLTGIEQKLDFVNECYINNCFSAGDMLPVLFQEQHTLPEHKALREKFFKKIQKNIERLIKEEGYTPPDPLLIQALMSGIDRVVLVLSMKKGSTESKQAKAIDVVAQLYRPLIKSQSLT